VTFCNILTERINLFVLQTSYLNNININMWYKFKIG